MFFWFFFFFFFCQLCCQRLPNNSGFKRFLFKPSSSLTSPSRPSVLPINIPSPLLLKQRWKHELKTQNCIAFLLQNTVVTVGVFSTSSDAPFTKQLITWKLLLLLLLSFTVLYTKHSLGNFDIYKHSLDNFYILIFCIQLWIKENEHSSSSIIFFSPFLRSCLNKAMLAFLVSIIINDTGDTACKSIVKYCHS